LYVDLHKTGPEVRREKRVSEHQTS
jgi:hypothetical protein